MSNARPSTQILKNRPGTRQVKPGSRQTTQTTDQTLNQTSRKVSKIPVHTQGSVRGTVIENEYKRRDRTTDNAVLNGASEEGKSQSSRTFTRSGKQRNSARGSSSHQITNAHKPTPKLTNAAASSKETPRNEATTNKDENQKKNVAQPNHLHTVDEKKKRDRAHENGRDKTCMRVTENEGKPTDKSKAEPEFSELHNPVAGSSSRQTTKVKVLSPSAQNRINSEKQHSRSNVLDSSRKEQIEDEIVSDSKFQDPRQEEGRQFKPITPNLQASAMQGMRENEMNSRRTTLIKNKISRENTDGKKTNNEMKRTSSQQNTEEKQTSSGLSAEVRDSSSLQDTEVIQTSSRQNPRVEQTPSRQNTEVKKTPSRQNTEVKQTTSRQNTEIKQATSRQNIEMKQTRSRQNTEVKQTKSRQNTEVKQATSRQNTEVKQKSSRQNTEVKQTNLKPTADVTKARSQQNTSIKESSSTRDMEEVHSHAQQSVQDSTDTRNNNLRTTVQMGEKTPTTAHKTEQGKGNVGDDDDEDDDWPDIRQLTPMNTSFSRHHTRVESRQDAKSRSSDTGEAREKPESRPRPSPEVPPLVLASSAGSTDPELNETTSLPELKSKEPGENQCSYCDMTFRSKIQLNYHKSKLCVAQPLDVINDLRETRAFFTLGNSSVIHSTPRGWSMSTKAPLRISRDYSIDDHHRKITNFHWDKGFNGRVPEFAVKAGYDYTAECSVYVCRARVNKEQVPGKVVPSSKRAYVSCAGHEIEVTDYEILTDPHELLSWKQTEVSGGIPRGAKKGGHDANDLIYYIARAEAPDGSMCCGRYVPQDRKCYYPWKGQELSSVKFEFLCKKSS